MGAPISPGHLWQPPLYKGDQGGWVHSYWDAVAECRSDLLTWDLGAMMSIISLGYACGDVSLLKQVTRSPWLSLVVENDKNCTLSEIPPHGRQWADHKTIANNLLNLLCDEARRVCKGRKEILILLSGGLDSRIVAGVLGRLYREGELACRPRAVTWGLNDSRDVVYGKAVADLMGFEWIHVALGPENVMENIDLTVNMGSLFAPTHLHNMRWFKQVPRDALVLAGSYGDSVGRAEFSSVWLLELEYLRPYNHLGLMQSHVCGQALSDIQTQQKRLRDRSPGQPKYVLCEHEQQGHYMRGCISQVMHIINRYCTLYQMFTDPAVYGYMWSLHPSLRDDRVYKCLFEQLSPELARLPWARTNRALQGKTTGSLSHLKQKFHDYAGWIRGPLFKRISEIVEPDWYEQTGIFDSSSIGRLRNSIKSDTTGASLNFKEYENWLWLACFRKFAQQCSHVGKTVELGQTADSQCPEQALPTTRYKHCWLRKILAKSKTLRQNYRKIKRGLIKKSSLKQYPPQQNSVGGPYKK